ncbi:uncharacterized protein LOC132554210 [Ylistrum balloti]|uniref:uncharacterized protein LOC132554210 n=1 Tax=Ylistrum balloti TaxID=509963 RepID=UPI002905F51E|nr:uncharacterized protein LOC132554210 [Ylistrum balloti]
MAGKRRNQRGLQTLAQGSLALARTHATEAALQNIESQLEKELEREEAASKSAKPLARVRHKGQKFLHSKHVLLIIVGLNVIDCILVLGELILDVHFIVDLLDTSDKQSQQFQSAIEEKYPDVPPVYDIKQLYEELLLADISWKNKEVNNGSHAALHYHKKRDITHSNGDQPKYLKTAHGSNHGNDSDSHEQGHGHHEHSIIEDIAHGLHKASITILAILVVETGIKVFCEGRRIFERKVEVFDSIIVVVSFTLDLVFIKGLTMFPIQKYVFILAFLVPWRVIRVVNSLIVAVMDHGHFRLKLLYSQKKKISASLKSTKQELKALQMGMQGVRKLCAEAGIPEWKFQQSIVGENNNHTPSKSIASLFASSKLPMKRRSSDSKQDTNSKGVYRSSTSAIPQKGGDPNNLEESVNDNITRNSSSVVTFNIDESNESTGLMNNDEDINSH